MASSSQNVSGKLTGIELVAHVPKVETEEQVPPVIISLLHNSRPDLRLQPSEVPDEEIPFKLPKNCYQDLFVYTEQRVVEGGLRNIHWSATIDFRLPEDSMNQILERDEEVRSVYGAGGIPMTLAERLAGWKIENRERPRLERYDKFFHHKSGVQFRTFAGVVRFISYATFPSRAPRNEAQNQVPLAAEALGSEELQAAMLLKRKRAVPVSLGSNREGENTATAPERFFKEARQKLLNTGIQNKVLQTSNNINKSPQACFSIEFVVECLERERKMRTDENLRQHDKQKGKEKEKDNEMENENENESDSSSSEEVTPHRTPERGGEYVRRFDNIEEYNMPQENQDIMRIEEGETLTRLWEKTEQETEGVTTIPDLFIRDEDLVGLEDFLSDSE